MSSDPLLDHYCTLLPNMARYTIGLVHSIAYFIEPMTEAYGMTFILFLFSVVVEFWVLLNFIPCNTSKNSFFDYSILNYFKILSRYVLIEKSYQASWSISIDLDAQYLSSFTEVFLRKTPFKHSFMLCRIILHYLRSTICHSHILIRNVVVLPLTFL